MSSIEGLPARGSEVAILIKNVHLHPLSVLVEFWGKVIQDKMGNYESLAKEIQSPGNPFLEFEGNPGDQCLVQTDGTWHRSRIVLRNGSKYTVFLFDKGITCSTTTNNLARGKKEHFHLPPEVEHCVLANVLPFSPENRWSPVALEFLKSLSGKSVKAYVQDVLIHQRTLLLHIHCISRQIYEMGFAKKLSPDKFKDFLHTSLQSHSGAEAPPETGKVYIGAGERLHKQELFMYPELPAGTVETVIVTEVTNPQRIFCQLKVFCKELNKLSEQITKSYEGRMTNCIVSPEMVGFPCSARGSDGRWFRSILQQVFPTCKMVEVLNVDHGTKQFVQVENVRPLAPEFFRMPVVTYVCSLYGIIEKGVGWTNSQVDYLRSLLLYKTMIAKFEYQSISEGVHYVTLYGDENININNLFGSKERCLLECEKTLDDYAIQSTTYSCRHPVKEEENQTKLISQEGRERVEKLPVEEISLGSSHLAVVQHITDPSEFWIRTQNYADDFDELMDGIYNLYKDSVNKDVLRNPTVGSYCAAKAKDGGFYRATVTELGETKIRVFFVDYGNTEIVKRSDIRTLPDEFKILPCLALKCSLAGVKPKDVRWSPRTSEFFTEAVTDQTLNVNVTAKYDESYVVKLSDPEVEGEKDVSTLMCSSGLAERSETQRQSEVKQTMQLASSSPTHLPDARLSGVNRNNEISFHTLNTVGPTGDERRICKFKEHMFSIGNVLDVNVSHIESPNDFWCQLVQNSAHLKLLMHTIQTRYGNSEFQPIVETACVARHPHNGMWYRALVIHKHESHHVDVLFVDYGQTEKVSIYDLRRVSSEFLTLGGQAFRCSLLNLADPTSSTSAWNDEAVARFHSFVETAASSFVILKCTIYAVMYSEQKIVFNIVDLETPFESVSTSIMGLAKVSPPMNNAGPSCRLDTYYYSTHDVKTGTEEQLSVTCVTSVSQFYCQLERNADVIKDLKIKVNNLCHHLKNMKVPTVFGTLCFAKYLDGHWYRGQIKATKPTILVHFVDYGDTIEVEKSDLLPIPKEANDIMSVPVQSVLCSLSDVPVDVPKEANRWFGTRATESKFQALVVARQPDGKLLVELYHGKTQINSKLKKIFQIKMQMEEHTSIPCQGHKAYKASANPEPKTLKPHPKQDAEVKNHTQAIKTSVSGLEVTRQMRDTNMNLQTPPKHLHHVGGNVQKLKAPLELYRPPHQRQSNGMKPNSTKEVYEAADVDVTARNESLPTETKRLIMSSSPGTESQEKSDSDKLPALSDLPSKCITSGMEEEVYVSHCNSPLSFYVQLVREEDGLFSLVEKLNDTQSNLQTHNIKDVSPGDLVQAEFVDDSSWYRAFVKEMPGNAMAVVEFVDFGNIAMVPISKISRLDNYFLQLPMYSIHCMLSEAAALGKEQVLDPKVVSSFREDISGDGVFKCQFIRQSGSVWEVSLEERGVNVTCKIPLGCATDDSEKLVSNQENPALNSNIRQNSNKSQMNSCSLCYQQQELSDGQQLKAYITSINDDLTFWCQAEDSDDLSVIVQVQNADHEQMNPDTLSPGSPCIALFSDDLSWYRAEVINKDGDYLSVLFVDFGNMSQVSVTDVREIPIILMEKPPQAFLCELDGFDSSHGSWESGAADEFSVLTADKVLQLTFTRVTGEEGKIKCIVQMECGGQVINEALKTHWNTSTTDEKSGSFGPTASYETTLQRDSTTKDAAPPEDHRENVKIPEMHIAGAHIHTPRDLFDEQRADKCIDLETSETPEPKGNETSENYLHSLTNVESPEEKMEQIFSESNMNDKTGIRKSTEILGESYSDEGMDLVPSIVVPQNKPKDIFPSDSGIGESMFFPPDNESDQSILILCCHKTAEENDDDDDDDTEDGGDSMLDTVGPNAITSPLDQNYIVAIDESLPGDVNACDVESSHGILSNPNRPMNNSRVTTSAKDISLGTRTTVKMVSRKIVCPADEVFQDLKQTALPLSSCVFPVFESYYKSLRLNVSSGNAKNIDCIALKIRDEGCEASYDVPGEVPCSSTKVENDLITEETLDDYEDTISVFVAESTSEPNTFTAPAQDLGDVVQELSRDTDMASMKDLCTEPNEERDDGLTNARDDCFGSKTTEELVQKESMLPCQDVPEEQSLALSSDTETQAASVPCPDLSHLVEEVTCLVGQICLTEVSTGPKECKPIDSEPPVQRSSTPKSTKDLGDGVLVDEICAEDRFEEQLTRITHLTLNIIDICSSELLPEE